MATNVTLKRVNATSGSTDDLHPTTDWSQIESKPSTFAPTSHDSDHDTHNDARYAAIDDVGTVGALDLNNSTTQFLRGDGTFATPAGSTFNGGTITNNLTIDSASFASLTLDRESTTSSSIVQFTNNGGVVGGIGGFGNDGLQFRTKDGTKMVLDASNNVGIGTDSPGFNLELEGSSGMGIGKSSSSHHLVLSNRDNYANDTSNSHIWASSGSTGAFSGEGAHMVLETRQSARNIYYKVGNVTAPQHIMNYSGNVGIGTLNPDEKLTVSGKIKANDNFEHTGSGGYYLLTSSDGFRGAFYDNGSYTSIYGDGNGSTPVININSDNVGVGITSPQTKLHIVGADSDGSAATLRVGGPSNGTGNNTSRLELVESTTNSNADMSYGFSFTADGSSTNNFLLRSHNNSTTGVIGLSQSRATGNVGIKTSGPGSAYALDVNGDVRGNRYYDRNDTNYYVDPASTSVINALNVNRLEVEGAIFDTENDQLRMPFPKGGYYTNGSSNVTGAIEITLPSGTHGNYTMISFFVDVFDYNGGADGESFTMHLGGYVNGTTWTHTFANMVTVGRTDRFFNVRYNVDGTANKIYIAETTNNWSYPKIQIRDFMAGHSGADDADWYNNAFTIDITTTIDGTTAREKTLESVATWADQVDVNSSSSSSYYNLLWHSGDTIYYAGSNKLRVQPSTGNIQIDGNDVATQSYVDLEIAQLVDSAPGTLNTLNELAAALGDDANFSTTVTNSIATKLPLAGGTMSGSIAMANNNITGINQIEINDPGEGIVFKQGSSGDMTLKIIDDSTDNILEYSGSSAKFRVAGSLDIKSSNPLLTLQDTGTTTGNAYIDYQAGTSLKVHAGGDALTFVAGNAERARIANNGKMGLGTIAPGAMLHIVDSTSGSELAKFRNDGDTADITIKTTSGAVGVIKSGAGDPLQLSTNGSDTQGIRIDTSGNVAVGTTTPLAKLTVKGDDGLYIATENNNPTNGAWIRFSDHSSQAQYGFIKYKHANQTVSTEPVNSDDGFIIGGSEANTVVSIEGSLNVEGQTNFEGQVELDAGDLIVRSGTVSANSYRSVLRDNSLENQATNGNADIGINYYGYAGGTTQFRDLNVYDGKTNLIATFDGSAGSVGIGTSTPQAKLDVMESIRISRTATYTSHWKQFISHTGTSNYGSLYLDSNSSTGDFIVRPNLSEKFRVKANGEVTASYGRLSSVEYNGSDVNKVNFALSGSTLTITTS